MIEKFLEIEYKENLFKKEYNGIQLWPLVREKLYFKILREVQNMPHGMKEASELGFIKVSKIVIYIIWNSIRYLFRDKSNAEILVLTHPRRKKVGAYYQDIYTYPVLDSLEYSYKVFERMFQFEHYKPVKQAITYLDGIEFSALCFSKMFPVKLSNEQKEYWKHVEQKLSKTFGVGKLGIIEIIESELSKFKYLQKPIAKLINECSPNLIIEVVGYNRINKVVNYIARSKHIPTMELQHGLIYKKHIGYNFPPNVEVPTFPQYLSVWGKFWKRNNSVPINDRKILIHGFKYFNDQALKYSNNQLGNHNKYNILFISQGPIGDKLSPIALELANKLKHSNTQVYYKLHPSEIIDKHERYPHLYKQKEMNILDSREDNLYQLISNADVVVGVGSTALIEATGFAKKVFVLKLSGIIPLNEFIEAPNLDMEVVEDANELFKKIKNMKAGYKDNVHKHHEFLFADFNFDLKDVIHKH